LNSLTGSVRSRSFPRLPPMAIIFGLAALGGALICYAYWPGVMIDDARWQYQQVVDNAFEDWHPPLMAWLWRRLALIVPGPAPMFVLQLALYWIGFALVASWAYRSARPRLALALVCAAWLPATFALMGTVTKDALMAATLVVATGLLLWRSMVQGTAARAALAAGTMVTLLFASALRHNAFFACVPLALAALPNCLVRTKPRLLAGGVALSGIFLMTTPAVSALVGAERTGVELSLIIFDLGGITERTGISQFPDMHVRDPVAVNHRCYDPFEWDSYSSWAKKPCPLGFEPFQALIDNDDLNPRPLWAQSILSHPRAYLEHRLTHFNLSSWFLVPDGPGFTAWSQSVPNPWGYRVRQNAVLTSVNAVADVAAATPIGWPIFWIAVALAASVAGLMAGLPRALIAIAASPLLYGLGYMIVGVATGIRYYMWTFSGAALAGLIVAGELWRRRRLPNSRRAGVAAAAVIAVPTLLAVASRMAIW